MSTPTGPNAAATAAAREIARRADGRFGTRPRHEAGVDLGGYDPAADPVMSDVDYDDYFNGSGWGTHRPSAVAGDIAEVRVGDVLANHSDQFFARNLLRVDSVDTDRGILHGVFVDPDDTSQLRHPTDREVAVWDFDLTRGEHFFTDVRG